MFGLKRFSMMGMPTLYFDESAGAGGGSGDAGDSTENSSGAGGDQVTDKNAGDGKDKPDKPTAKVSFSAEQQAEVDRIVKDRLDRERKKSEETAEKARKKSEEDALSQNKQFEELANTRQGKIVELEKKLQENETVASALQQYKEVVAGIVKNQVANLPKPVKSLIEKMDPLEQMQYLVKNAKELNIEIKPVPPTDTDDSNNKLQKEELEKARRKGEQTIKGFFR